MTFKEHLRSNVRLAWPVVIGQLGHIMVSVTDSVMIGHVGVVPLAAATLSSSVHHLLMFFGIGVSYAITPMVAATEPKHASRLANILHSGLVMCAGLGLLLTLLGLFITQFIPHLGQDQDVATTAQPYLSIICVSIIPLMMFQTFRQFSEGQSDTLLPMVVSILANILNIALNYIMIYGKFGLPAMGLNGAGYATLLSRMAMFIMMLWLAKGKRGQCRQRVDFTMIARLLTIGIPSGLQYIFEIGAFGIAAIMIGWIGPQALAAHNIAANLAAITYMAATGLAAASTIRIGNQMLRKDRKNLRIAGFSSLGIVAAFMAACGLLFIAFRFQLPALYIQDESVRDITSTLLVIVATFQISDGLQAVGLGNLRGLMDVRIPTLVTLFSYWFIAIPLGYVLGFVLGLGVHGVWYALCLGLSLAAVLHVWRFHAFSKRIQFH